VFEVNIGGPQHDTFCPPEVKGSIGDLVRFKFGNDNYTVSQSDDNGPCESNGSFDVDLAAMPQHRIVDFQITNTGVMWFSARGGHLTTVITRILPSIKVVRHQSSLGLDSFA
jgi:hypothetical protein